MHPWGHVYTSQMYLYMKVKVHRSIQAQKQLTTVLLLEQECQRSSSICKLCYFWEVCLRIPLARHKTKEESSIISNTAWCFHGNRFSSFSEDMTTEWLGEKEDMFTIFRSNNCFISSPNTCLTTLNGLMASELVLQRKWEQGHCASLFKTPIRNLLTLNSKRIASNKRSKCRKFLLGKSYICSKGVISMYALHGLYYCRVISLKSFRNKITFPQLPCTYLQALGC